MNRFRLILIGIILLCCISCNDKATKDKIDSIILSDYRQKYNDALISNDKDKVGDAIEYINELLLSSDSGIQSLSYNKAQLLYKLGKYEEAVAVMIENSDGTSAYYTATLLIRGGDKYADIGLKILFNLIRKNEHLIFTKKYNEEEKMQLVEYISILYILADKDVNVFYSRLDKLEILDSSKIKIIKTNFFFSKEKLLETMWPQ